MCFGIHNTVVDAINQLHRAQTGIFLIILLGQCIKFHAPWERSIHNVGQWINRVQSLQLLLEDYGSQFVCFDGMHNTITDVINQLHRVPLELVKGILMTLMHTNNSLYKIYALSKHLILRKISISGVGDGCNGVEKSNGGKNDFSSPLCNIKWSNIIIFQNIHQIKLFIDNKQAKNSIIWNGPHPP